MTAPAAGRIEYKARRRFQIKATGGGWEVAGYASTFNDATPDAYGDVVARGAFTRSIAARTTKLLYEHREPIGNQLELREDSHGLWGRWSIVDTASGHDAHTLALAGVLDGLSIGYIPTQVEDRPDGVRVIREANLFEVSLVAIPANENAVVQSVKSGGSVMSVAERLAARVAALPAPDRRSIGARIATSSEVKAFLASQAPSAVLTLKDVSLKALLTSLPQPADVRADRLGAVTPAPDFLSYIPTLPAENNVVRIVQITATNAAAPTSEATATSGTSGTKPESGLAFPAIEVPVETIPTWIPATRRVLDDGGADLQNVVDTELGRMLRSVVEANVAGGSGTAPNLHGIATWPGVATIAVGGGTPVGALVAAVAAVRTSSGFDATIIGMEAAAWAALLVASGLASGTLGAPGVTGAPNVLGVPILPCQGLASGTALVGNGPSAGLYELEEVTIELGWTGDQFVRNCVTILAETRVASGVTRPSAWKLVTGLPTS